MHVFITLWSMKVIFIAKSSFPHISNVAIFFDSVPNSKVFSSNVIFWCTSFMNGTFDLTTQSIALETFRCCLLSRRVHCALTAQGMNVQNGMQTMQFGYMKNFRCNCKIKDFRKRRWECICAHKSGYEWFSRCRYRKAAVRIFHTATE